MGEVVDTAELLDYSIIPYIRRRGVNRDITAVDEAVRVGVAGLNAVCRAFRPAGTVSKIDRSKRRIELGDVENYVN